MSGQQWSCLAADKKLYPKFQNLPGVIYIADYNLKSLPNPFMGVGSRMPSVLTDSQSVPSNPGSEVPIRALFLLGDF